MIQIADKIQVLLDEVNSCNIPIPIKKSTQILMRILEDFLEDKDSPFSVIRMNFGNDFVNALVNSIIGSFAGSELVAAKKMTKEETENLVDSLLYSEIGKA